MALSALKDGGSTRRWRSIRERILKRDDNICQHCGQYGDTVDHIVPRRLGGDDNWENLQCLCRSCNYAKGGRLGPAKGKSEGGSGFFDVARTPPTPLVPFFPENGKIVHYEE